MITDQMLDPATLAWVLKPRLRTEFLDFEEGKEFFAEIARFKVDAFVEGENMHDRLYEL